MLLDTFRTSSQEILLDLRAALRDSDRPAIKRHAHKLKGGARSACADRLGDLAAKLENEAMESPQAAVLDLVQQIARLVESIPADLDALARSAAA